MACRLQYAPSVKRIYRHMCARSGFTLVEMMIVISIVGVLAMVSVPAFGKYMQSWRLNGEANEIASYLRAARNAAIAKNIDAILVFDTVNNAFYYIEDTDRDGTRGIDEYQSGTQVLGSGITYDSFTTPQKWVTFGPKGNTIDGGAIILKNRLNNTRTIRIFSGTGIVVVE